MLGLVERGKTSRGFACGSWSKLLRGLVKRAWREASEHILEAFGRAKYSQRTAYSIAALPAPSYAVQTVFGSLCAFSNFSKHA